MTRCLVLFTRFTGLQVHTSVLGRRLSYCAIDSESKPPNGLELSYPAEAGRPISTLRHASGQDKRPIKDQPAGSVSLARGPGRQRVVRRQCTSTHPGPFHLSTRRCLTCSIPEIQAVGTHPAPSELLLERKSDTP